ncbi:MAG: nucleoside 2-deoxyribosyltransferase [Bacteroidaceae bacterium]|nr:nucleoside 2-deoxyribosyltransferase [Bacteroidaceae bacterium]
MICLVGDILTDVTLATVNNPLKMRLGGIVHAARALWAMEVDYSVAYFAPAYLDGHIDMFLKEHNCNTIIKLGNVTNSPYTMLIQEVKEVGDQGYEFLYHDNVEINYDISAINMLNDYNELVFISGNYDMEKVLNSLEGGKRIHCDVANNVDDITGLPTDYQFETLFVSTSSNLFKNHYSEFDAFCDLLKPYTRRIVLKENRGGSRVYDSISNETYQVPSQTSPITHSVGVGDVYDVVSITAPYDNYSEKLLMASWVAMEYAMTTFPDNFKNSVKNLLNIPIVDLKNQGGCILPWEIRENCQIYIAAPDFSFVDTKQIDVLCDSLSYHHFVARRPIKENGQMQEGADKKERIGLFCADMKLLSECNMLIAVLLYNDPGTLLEIGLAAQKGIPTLVYDPEGMADNCMLTELPTLVSNDLDKIIAKVFIEYSKMYRNGTF